MARRAIETPLGALSLEGDEDLFEPILPIALDAARAGRSDGRFLEAGGRSGYWKGSAFRGKARLRHAMRMAVLRRPAPRRKEIENLRWLREHGFDAARPLVGGILWRGWGPVFQFLLTETVPGARTLEECFCEDPAAPRGAILESLALLVARMHSLGFIHHDLHARNILVTTEGRIVFIDAWRGGPPPQLRGRSYDLACLLVEGAELFSREEQALFFDAYFGPDTRGAERARLLRRAERSRRVLVRRLRERRRPRAVLPTLEWDIGPLMERARGC